MSYRRVSHYLLKEKLGEGNYGEVFIGEDLNTGEVRAIKRIKKKKLFSPHALELQMREINIMRLLNHENIVRLYDYTSTNNHLYIVMEFCSGKDLTQKRGVGEEQTLVYMRQLVAGLAVLREKRIAHRDLKPENILLSDETPNAKVKIGDFGVARTLDEASLAKTYVGTPYYMAPEVSMLFQEVGARYNESADLWSLGVIVFELISGNRLFPARDRDELMLMQKEERKTTDMINRLEVSSQFKQLLCEILRYNSANRILFHELQQHPLISGVGLTRPLVDLSKVECLKPYSKDCVSPEDALAHSRILVRQAKKVAHPFPFYTLACKILKPFVSNRPEAKDAFLSCFAEAEIAKNKTEWRSTSLNRVLAEQAVHLSKKAASCDEESVSKAWELYEHALVLLKYVEEGPAVVKFREVVRKQMAQLYP